MTRMIWPTLATALSVLACPVARGDIITLYNTGVNSNGTLATGGTTDLHYQLVSAPTGVNLTAYVATAIPSNYDQSVGSSKFISPVADVTTYLPIGDYAYRTTFDLTGFLANTARITGRFETDNVGKIFLNGIDTGITSPTDGFAFFTNFSIASGFVAGLNTLEFRVNNSGGPTSLRVEMTGTASLVPEPSSVTLVGCGLVALAMIAHRRQGRIPSSESSPG